MSEHTRHIHSLRELENSGIPHWVKLAEDLLGLHHNNRTRAQDHWMKWVQKCQKLQKILDLPPRDQLDRAEECAFVTFTATLDLRGMCLVCARVPEELVALMERWLADV
ncbi:hypothetical protein AB0I75_35680 [Streptomyces sp. NPDC050273]|uniref:hypothetical protein n=1 Tax=Streptomyces sp. NPDC050273 TaxID=3154933 RepID=UPI003436EB1F